MKTQLLMIIAVIVSSLLTISQRANAQEMSQLPWLEPTVEERFDEVVASDQDSNSHFDKDDIYFTLFINEVHSAYHCSICFKYHSHITNKINKSVSPRAPPVSLI